MAVLTWGIGSFEHKDSVGGEPKAEGAWDKIDIPTQDSLKVETKEGETIEAKDEAGNVVDSRTTPSSYEITFDLFVKKGVALPFTDKDGIIDGEHAFRYIPEDPTCEGWQADRTTVSSTILFSTKEGAKYRYKVKVLKPKTGNAFKMQVIS
mgnify:FL=1|nr:MAG TPA: hypothetical protein [Caudoviricetes sp.]DAY32049.1 MAG TPA: hypothetical protein [Caudoviricetes sp.]